MKALFLYTELAGYFANCIRVFKEQYHAEVSVVCYPTNADAPFSIEIPGVNFISKNALAPDALYKLCLDLQVDVVYVTGWSDPLYKKICRRLRQSNVPVVCGVDNFWRGDLRQRLACLFSGTLLKPFFSHLWVAGQRQYEFARRLGYSSSAILSGLYAADVEVFAKAIDLPLHKYIVYVGRFESIKGVHELYTAFSSLSEHERKGWTLKMIGNGSLRSEFQQREGIEIHPFMQPEALMAFAGDTGGFILPSRQEPWGVVVHEFAAAGKPILLSNQVSSGEQFLIHQYNGFSFDLNDPGALKNALIEFIALSDDERKEMGKRSLELAMANNPVKWAAKLASVCKEISHVQLLNQ